MPEVLGSIPNTKHTTNVGMMNAVFCSLILLWFNMNELEIYKYRFRLSVV